MSTWDPVITTETTKDRKTKVLVAKYQLQWSLYLRTLLYKGHNFLAASTVNACGAPSHQRTPL